MVGRRFLLAAVIPAIGFSAMPALAFEPAPFNAREFAAAQEAGKPILIDVTAPWCPTCKAQKVILSDLAQQPKFKDLVVFHVDFDTQEDVLHKFGVFVQSTLIVFKGAKEIARSSGETKKSSIESLLEKAL
ncbi:Thioredoxin [Enhydrobacter aerosaccus]|uniref:Thioredoxin n=1 Tax=Enhydrobacter aerosaccus TaxID=225324 RepID=A0A1T4S992_9HYPH|nr:thioredoxin family protein [Enhydrobacter aerosaccus]SKA24870.1 Thioredoxin [Enhydrobacter aerosaccus]